MAQDKMKHAENDESNHQYSQRVKLCANGEQENAGEQAINSHHAE
jgi:hypothetical protein